MSLPTPQQLMEECGLLIIVQPQSDLGTMLLFAARERGQIPRLQNTLGI